MNTTSIFKKTLLTGLCASMLALAGCASSGGQPHGIESSMEHMGHAFGGAMKSTTLEQFKTHFNAFEQSVAGAAAQTYNGTADERAQYAQGMKELQQGIADTKVALASNNLDTAKAAFGKLIPIQKRYHATLKK